MQNSKLLYNFVENYFQLVNKDDLELEFSLALTDNLAAILDTKIAHS